MNVLIINLAEATDRLSFQEKQMLRLGLDYEILRAVSTQHISESTYYQLSMGWERPLRRAELACFLSHHKAWQTVLKKKQPMLILEDDALLSRYSAVLLKMLEQRSDCDCDLVTLEVRNRQKIVGEGQPLVEDFSLVPLYQDRTGAAAYVLWPSGAQILLDKAKTTPPGLADAFISSTYGLSCLQVEPAAAIQLDQCEAYEVNNTLKTISSISAEAKPDLTYASPLENIRFHARRLGAQYRLGMRRIQTMGKGERRFIKLRPEDFV